jgi:hypothetical protein
MTSITVLIFAVLLVVTTTHAVSPLRIMADRASGNRHLHLEIITGHFFRLNYVSVGDAINDSVAMKAMTSIGNPVDLGHAFGWELTDETARLLPV